MSEKVDNDLKLVNTYINAFDVADDCIYRLLSECHTDEVKELADGLKEGMQILRTYIHEMLKKIQ